jgi:acyl-CoA reductase-like NAD-dependent aldehyde dehydrogenase
MSDYNLLIDGQMVAGDLTMAVLNPGTEEVLAQCPRASKEQLDRAVAAAKAAYPARAATPIEERAMTLSTPFGSASLISSAKRRVASGVVGAGFTTSVLPASSAEGSLKMSSG